MAEGDIGAVIAELEFEAGVATSPKLLHVLGDIFAIAYTGPDGDGWIVTVDIDSAGSITDPVVAAFEFEAGAAYQIDFIKVTNGVFAVVYKDAVNDGWIKTVAIDAAGVISLTGMDSFEFETGECNNPCWVKVAGNIFAIAYRNASLYGRVVSVSISDAGAIGDPVLSSLNFETVRGIDPHIIHVTGDIYAIVYQGVDDDGWIVAVDIDSSGAITDPAAAAFEFETTDVGNCRILQIAAGIYVIAFKNAASDGDLTTVSIDSAGVVGDPVLDDQEFDGVGGAEPSIIHVSGDFFAIAYRGSAGLGQLKTWEISAAGTIAALKQDELTFDATYGAYPTILHVSGNIYAIAYTSGGTGGKVISLDIETVGPAAAKQHLMLMGVG